MPMPTSPAPPTTSVSPLRSDGKVVAEMGGASDTSIVSSTGGYNTASWHHVLFTRDQDDRRVAVCRRRLGRVGNRKHSFSHRSAEPSNFGRIQSSSNYFSGSRDEVAVYTTVLPGRRSAQ